MELFFSASIWDKDVITRPASLTSTLHKCFSFFFSLLHFSFNGHVFNFLHFSFWDVIFYCRERKLSSEGFLQLKLMLWLVPFKCLFCFFFDCWLLQTCMMRWKASLLRISFETWPLFAFSWKHVLLRNAAVIKVAPLYGTRGTVYKHISFKVFLYSEGIGTLSLSLLFDKYLGFTHWVK